MIWPQRDIFLLGPSQCGGISIVRLNASIAQQLTAAWMGNKSVSMRENKRHWTWRFSHMLGRLGQREQLSILLDCQPAAIDLPNPVQRIVRWKKCGSGCAEGLPLGDGTCERAGAAVANEVFSSTRSCVEIGKRPRQTTDECKIWANERDSLPKETDVGAPPRGAISSPGRGERPDVVQVKSGA